MVFLIRDSTTSGIPARTRSPSPYRTVIKQAAKIHEFVSDIHAEHRVVPQAPMLLLGTDGFFPIFAALKTRH